MINLKLYVVSSLTYLLIVAFLKALKCRPFEENFFELSVKNTIDQSIDACRKVNQGK